MNILRHARALLSQALLPAVLALAVLGLATPSAKAQSIWNGTALASGNRWSTVGNWKSGGIHNSAGATLGFNATVANTTLLLNTAGETIGNLSYNTTSQSITIGNLSGNILTLSVASGNATILLNSTGTLTLAGPLTLSNTTNIQFLSTANLLINATTFTSNNNNLFFNGTGTGTANISAIFSGSGNVTQSGSGTVLLSGAETYTGGTTINSGTLSFNGANSFTGGTVTLAGGTLNYNNVSALGSVNVVLTITGGNLDATNGTIASSFANAQNWNGDFTFKGTNSLNLGTGAVAMNAGRTVTISGNTLTVGGAISGSGFGVTLAAASAGTLALTNASSNYTGVTTINGGTLQVSTLAAGGAVSSIGNSTSAAANLVINGGTLQYMGASSQSTDRLFTIGTSGATIDSSNATNTIIFSNTGSLVMSGSAARTLTLSGTNTGTNTFAPVISDFDSSHVTSLNKVGAGNWTITGVNTFTGNTTVSGGSLILGGNLALENSVLNYNNFGGTLVLSSVANATMGGLAGSGQNLALPSNFGLVLNTASATNVTYSGILSGTNASVTKNGTGVENLSGANSYTGATIINGGTLAANTLAAGGAASSIGQSTNVAANLVINGGTLKYTGATVSTDRLFTIGANGATIDGSGTGSLTMNATGSIAFSSTNIAPTLTLTSANATSSNSLAAVISDPGTGANITSLTKSGVGNWTISGANTFTGNTTITGGNLVLGGNLALQNSVLYYNNLGGTLSFGALSNATLGGLAGSGQNLTLPSSFALTLDPGATTNVTYSGILSGTSATVTVNGNPTGFANGNGTQNLNGLNTYTGATTIINGTVGVNTLANGGSASSIGQSTSVAGSLTINGGTLQYLGASAQSTNRLFTIGNLGATIDASGTTAANTINFAGPGSLAFSDPANATTLVLTGNNTGLNIFAPTINSTGSNTTSLYKEGNGTWELNNLANAYNGTTTISGGTLSVTFLANGGLASSIGNSTNAASNLVIDNATLQYLGTTAQSTDRLMTVGPDGATFDASGTNTITFANTSTVVYNGQGISPTITFSGNNTGANTFDPIIANNITANGTGITSVTKSGTGNWTLNGANTFTGNTTITGGNLVLGNALALQNSVLNYNNLGGTINFGSLTNATLGGLAGGQGLALPGTFELDINTATGTNVTYSGILSGSGGAFVTVSGSGTQALSGVNTFSGGTTLFSGTLALNNGAALGSGSLEIDGGTLDNTSGGPVTLTNNNPQTWNNSFTFAGTNNLNMGTGDVTLGQSDLVTVSSGTLTVGGNISGAFGLSKLGAGTLILNGNNTYTGGTTLNGGTLDINNGGSGAGSAIGTGTLALVSGTLDNTSGSPVTLATNNQVDLYGNFTFAGSNVLNVGTGGETLFTNITITTTGSTLTLGGNLSGGFSITKAGAGNLTLGGSSTYSGGTVLNAGKLNINNSGNSAGWALGTGPLTINGGMIDNTSGATVSSALTNPNAINWNADFTFGGTNALNLGTGAVTMNASHTVTISGNTLTLGGIISGSAGLTVNGTGNLALTNTSSNYTGVTTINSGATLIVSTLASGGAVSSIGNSSSAAANLVINGGTLQFVGSSAQTTDRLFTIGTGGAATIDASGTNASNTITFTNTGLVFANPSAPATLTLTGNNTGLNTFDPVIANSGVTANLTSLVKNGTGEWVLNATNTYTGGTTINAGTLAIQTAGALGGNATSGAITFAGGNLDSITNGLTLTNNNAQNWNSSFTFVGTQSLNMGTGLVTLGQNEVVTIAANTLTVGGIITDSTNTYGLTKAGPGTLVLSGINTYNGTTTIAGGTLKLDFNLATGLTDIVNSTSVLAFNGGTLALNGKAASVNSNAFASTTINQGASTLTETNAGTSLNAKLGTVTRNAGGTLNITTAPTGALIVNGTFGVTNNVVTSNGIAYTTIAGTDWANFTGGNLATIAAASYSNNTAEGSWLATVNNRMNGNTTTLTAGRAIGTLTFCGTASTIALGANSLNVSTGGILLSSNATGGFTISGTGNVTGPDTASSELVFLTENASLTSTVSAIIKDASGTNSTAVTKSGAGNLILSGANNYTGATYLNEGTLSLGSATALGAVGANSILKINGGSLDASSAGLTVANTQNWNNNFTFVGTNSLTLGGQGTNGGAVLGSNVTLTTTANTLTEAGNISGAFSLTKAGVGGLALSGNNTYSGGTILSAGTLDINQGGDATHSAIGTGALTIAGGTTIDNTSSGTVTLGTNNAINLNGSVAYTGATQSLNLGTGNISLGASSTITVSGNTLTLGGNISDGGSALSLTKAGAGGTLVLGGVNTFSGNLNVTGGTVNITSANGLQNAVLNNTAGTVNFSTLEVNLGGLSGSFNINNESIGVVTSSTTNVTYSGALTGSTFLALSGNGSETLSGTNTNSGGISLNGGTLVLANNSALGAGVFGIGGTGTNTLNTSGTFASSTNNAIQMDNGFTFVGNTGSLNFGTGAVALGGSNVTLNIAANTVTFGGAINDGGIGVSNANSITKTGAGNLSLTGINTFSGNLNLQLGTLTIGSNLSLQNATLNYTGATAVVAFGAGITNATFGGLAGTTNLAMPNLFTSLKINTNFYTSANYSGVLSNTTAMAVNITGNGTEIFSGANTYTGGTTLTSGTLAIANVGVAGTSSSIGTGAFTINGGTLDAINATTLVTNNTLTLGGSFTFAGSNNLNLGTGPVTLGTSPIITVNASTLTIGGIIGGSTQGITKAGNGTLALTNGSNTFTGATNINGGTLTVNTLALGGAVSGIGQSTNAAANLTFNGGTLQLISSVAGTQTTDRLFTISSAGATIDASTATATLTGNVVNFSGTSITINNGVSNTSLTLTGNSGNTTTPNTFSPIIANNGTGSTKTSLTKTGSGEWLLAGANTYSGGTFINQGTLAINVTGALGTGPITFNGGNIDNLSASALTLASANTQTWNSGFTFVGTHPLNLNTGAVTLGANDTITVNNSSTLTVGGAIGDAGHGYSISVAGTGTLALSGVNSFSGNMNVTTGAALSISGNSSLQNATLNNNGGTTSFTGGGTNVTVAGLAGSTAMTLPTGNLVIATNNGNVSAPTYANLSYTNVLSGSGNIILSGNGTENFSANNTYTGTTTLNGGTLGINSNGTSNTNSAIGTGQLILNGGTIDNNTNGNVSLAGSTNNAVKIAGGFAFQGTNNLNLGAGAVSFGTAGANYQIAINGSTLTLGGVIGAVNGTGTSIEMVGNQLAAFGGGTLVLSGANVFTGGVTVDAGQLDINNVAALGTGIFTLNGGSFDSLIASTTLSNHIGQVYEANVTFAGSNSLNMGTGAVTLKNTPVFTITGNTLTINGTVSNDSVNGTTSGLTLNGQGTLALTNASNNYSLATTINGGTLSINTIANGGSASGIGNSSNAASNLIINGGTLQVNAASASQTTDRSFTIGNNGATIDVSNTTAGNIVAFNGPGAVAFANTNVAETLTLTGNTGTAVAPNTFKLVIGDNGSGATSLIKSNSGAWAMNATNTYSGGTTINAGTLQILNGAAIGTGPLTFNGGNFDNGNASVTMLTNNNAQNWNSSFSYLGTQALNMGTGAVTLKNNLTATIVNTLTIGGLISDNGNGYTLTKAGAGTLVLSNNLSLQNSTLSMSAGAVTFGQNNATLGGLAGAGGLTGPTNALTLNPAFFFNNNYSGILTGGTMTLTLNGTGIQELSGANSYSGATTVNSGTLFINNAGALSTSALTMNGGNLDGGGQAITNALTLSKNFTFGAETGAGTLSQGTGTITLGQTEVINVQSSTLTLGGVIQATANGLTKTGNAGTLVLSGVNLYTGTTTVAGGTLQLNLSGGSNIIKNTNALAMNGGTLFINGSASNTQTFASTAINAGASTITGNQNAATNLTIVLGTVTRSIGGTVDFTLPTGTGNINGTLTSANNTVVDANGTAYATVSLLNFANVTASRIQPLGTYSANVTGAAGNFTAAVNDLTSTTSATLTGSGSFFLNTLTFNGGASTLNVGANTLQMNGGGILVRSNTTAANTISSAAGGVLTGKAVTGSELVIVIGNANTAQGLTISANIVNNGANALAVTKSGPGNLSLTGTNTYTNGTYLNAGTLSVGISSALGTGTLNINGGSLDASVGSLNPTNTQIWNNDWTFVGTSALTLGAQGATGGTNLGSNLTLTSSATNALTIAGNISGAFSLTSNTGILALNGSNTYSGGTILNSGTLDINANGTSTSNSALGTGNFTINGGKIENTSAGTVSLAATTNNPLILNAGFTYLGATQSLNLGTGAVALGANDTITVSGHTLTIGGNIGGSTTNGGATNSLPSQFGLTMVGASGTLVLSGNNSYNGLTTLTSGTLVLGSVGSVAGGNNIGTGGITLNGGTLAVNQGGNTTASALGMGTLTFNGGSIDNTSGSTVTVGTNNNITINASLTFVGSNALNLGNGNVTLTTVTPTVTTTASTLTLGGVVSGAFGITKAGGGTLVLGGNNTYTGVTTVNAGTLVLAANNALGVNAGGTFVTSGGTNGTLQLNAGYVTGSGNSSSTGSLLTITGNGAGGATGGALVSGGGTSNWIGNIALGGAATISSGTSAGATLTLGNTSALLGYYASTSNISIGGNVLTFVGGAGTTINDYAAITGNGGSVVVNTLGTVYEAVAYNSYTGPTTVSNGTLILDGPFNTTPVTQGQGYLNVASTTLNIGNTSGTGNTAVVQLGTGHGDVAKNVMNDNINVFINATGLLNLYGQTQTILNLTMNAGNISTNGSLASDFGGLYIDGNVNTLVNPVTAVINGNLAMNSSVGNSTTTFTILAGSNVTSDFTINANLTGGSMVKTGAGIMTLTNNQNTYTGSTEVATGTLVITAGHALGSNNNSSAEGTQVDANAQLRMVNTGSDLAVGQELLTINGNGNGTTLGDGALQNVSGNNSWAGTVIAATNATINTAASSNLTLTGCVGTSTTSTLTFNGNGNTTLSGNVYGGLSVVKNGTGVLLMNGSTQNAYTGTTAVNAGTLELNGPAAVALVHNFNTLTVNTGGTLLTDTSGQLGIGVNMTLNGGTWATNALNSTNAAAGATFTETLNSLTLTANSNINLGAGSNTLRFSDMTGTNWTPGQVLYINNWTGIAQVDGVGGGTGTDEILFGKLIGGYNPNALSGTSYSGQLGEIIFVNPQDPSNGLTGMSGNFHAVILGSGEVVPFLATPEPGTMAAGAGLCLLALLREWRRRKQRLTSHDVK